MQQKAANPDITLLEISRGYSVLNCKGDPLYFRHFSILESLGFNEYYENSLSSAKKSGIKGEDLILKDAIRNKKWSVEKEETIKELEWSIKKLGKASEKISDRTQRLATQQVIADKTKERDTLLENRRELCMMSAENFAESQKIKRIMTSSIYKDLGFNEVLKSEEMWQCSKFFFEKLAELNSQENLLNAAYKTQFFDVFCVNYRTPHILFPKVGLDLTVFQKNLVSAASSLLNKLKNVEIPDELLEDPVRILKYKPVEKKDGKTTEGVDDLKEKARQKGGVVTVEDFLT